ncbi:MAG: tRNA lysidine(34) synthetase TilS [Acidobacteria bacterium]|nr:tRNA lysidine(34) synthetase TilS [Acidobacteriota bacterium]
MVVSDRVDRLSRLVDDALSGLDNPSVLVGWSGGVDSTALLLAAASAGTVQAVHIHHGQDHSDDAKDHVRRVSAQLGVPLVVVRVSLDPGPGFEERARDARLQALADLCGEQSVVLLGHHRGDVVETVLHNLFRGTGPLGFSGPRPIRLPFVRPFLGESREALRAAVEEAGVDVFEDPTNRDTQATRNWIRHTILPAVTERMPQAADSIAHFAGIVGADETLLRESVPDVVRTFHGAISIPIAVAATLPPPVATRLVRQMLLQARPPDHAPRRDVNQVLEVVHGRMVHAQLTGGLIVEREAALAVVYDPDDVAVPSPAIVSVPGTVVFGTHRVTVNTTGVDLPLIGRNRALVRVTPDAPVEIRVSDVGERVAIEGGSKLVRDALAEVGVPSRLRSTWPVAVLHGKIAWIAGTRVAAWARPSGSNPDALVFSVERADR